MKITKLISFALLLCLLSSCQRGCQRMKRKLTNSPRSYTIQMYSGGKVVFEDSFRGIINQEEGNGCYYYKSDTLIELSGDYILKSIK